MARNNYFIASDTERGAEWDACGRVHVQMVRIIAYRRDANPPGRGPVLFWHHHLFACKVETHRPENNVLVKISQIQLALTLLVANQTWLIGPHRRSQGRRLEQQYVDCGPVGYVSVILQGVSPHNRRRLGSRVPALSALLVFGHQAL